MVHGQSNVKARSYFLLKNHSCLAKRCQPCTMPLVAPKLNEEATPDLSSMVIKQEVFLALLGMNLIRP